MPKRPSIEMRFVLADDVRVESASLEDESDTGDIEPGSFVVHRPGSRSAAKLVSRDTGQLLRCFSSPKRIIDAIIEYASRYECAAKSVLNDGFSILSKFVADQILVPEDSPNRKPLEPIYSSGQRLGSYGIRELVQIMSDTEVYRGVADDEAEVAIKVLRNEDERGVRWLAREAEILAEFDVPGGPQLLESGIDRSHKYIVMEWLDAELLAACAARLRATAGSDAMRALSKLIRNLGGAYAQLHEAGIVHGDVHPRNILVQHGQRIRLIDFGLADVPTGELASAHPGRGAAPGYTEPEYAAARLSSRRPPLQTYLGEQFCVAALIFSTLTGRPYTDFPSTKTEAYRAIIEGKRRSLRDFGCPWARETNYVIAKALSTEPSRRFADTRAFADALSESLLSDAKVSRPLSTGSFDFKTYALGIGETLCDVDAVKETVLVNGVFGSVWYGIAGIAYTLHRLAIQYDRADFLQAADLWLDVVRAHGDAPEAYADQSLEIDATIVGESSFFHCPSGIHLVQSLVSQSLGDFVSLAEAATAFLEASSNGTANSDLTIGTANILIGSCILLRLSESSDLVDSHVIRTRCDAVMERLAHGMAETPVAREQSGRHFVGIAHGWAGMIQAGLLYAHVTRQEVDGWVEHALSQLATLEVTAKGPGCWPRKVGRGVRKSEYLAGWCNGAAGIASLMCYGAVNCGADEYLETAKRAARFVEETRENSGGDLCCGLAGQSVALSCLAHYTGDTHWTALSNRLCKSAIEIIDQSSLRQNSLFKGRLGTVVAAAVCDTGNYPHMPLCWAE